MQRRNTNQRQIVFESLECLGHASVESLIEYIQMHYDHISIATIYRNIAILLETEKIKKIRLENEDVLETIKKDHAHFVCESCGDILDIAFDEKKMIKHYQKDLMHQINHCNTIFYGICQKCKLKEEKKDEVCM